MDSQRATQTRSFPEAVPGNKMGNNSYLVTMPLTIPENYLLQRVLQVEQPRKCKRERRRERKRRCRRDESDVPSSQGFRASGIPRCLLVVLVRL